MTEYRSTAMTATLPFAHRDLRVRSWVCSEPSEPERYQAKCTCKAEFEITDKVRADIDVQVHILDVLDLVHFKGRPA